MRKIVLLLISLIISSTLIPVITANNESTTDFNLKVEIEPFRKVFPHMYTLLVKAQFDCSYYCEEGTYTGGDTFTFQVIRLADNELIYSKEKEMEQLLNAGSGAGIIIDYSCYSGIRKFISFYEAKIILNINDSDQTDNEASCYFIVIDNI